MVSKYPNVKLDNFEGPFDLLLELARAHKVDVTTVSLAKITEEFLTYAQKGWVPSNVQADFLVVAATLLLFKLKQLLPRLTDDEEEEICDLTDRLRLYQLYRDKAMWIRENWCRQQLLPGPEQPVIKQPIPYPPYTAADIRQFMVSAIGKIKPPLNKRRHLRPRGRSLKECMALLQERLIRVKNVMFDEIVGHEDRQTKAVSFLALLEMSRQQQIDIRQEELFGAILIQPKKLS